MRRKNKYLLLLLFVLAVSPFSAQDKHEFRKEQSYRLQLNNEEIITGVVIGEDQEFVTIEKRPSFATVQVRKSTIISATLLASKDGLTEDPLGENNHADMYLVSSSVLPYEKGRFSSTSHWFLFDQIQYSFTENIAVYITSLAFFPCGAGLKFSKEISELTYIGADVSGAMQWGSDDAGSQVLGYMAQAKVTHGTSNRNITLGIGSMGINPNLTGQVNSGEMVTPSMVISAGFCNRFADRWAVVMDGYYLAEESILFGGFAFKFLRDEHIAWAFGAYSHVNDLGGPKTAGKSQFSIPIPFLSYSRKFY